MALEQPQKLYSYDDYAALGDDVRCQVLDGELIMTAAPRLWHQDLIGRIYRSMANHVAVQGGGKVYMSPCDVVLRAERPAVVVQPDLLFVSDARRSILMEANVHGAPDLVIEVLSPSNARIDTVHKRALYARYGVPEYWMVMSDADQIEVLKLEANGLYGRPVVYEPGDVLSTPALPGFELSLASVFEGAGA